MKPNMMTRHCGPTLLVLMTLFTLGAQAQEVNPSRAAAKSYAKALEAYRFLSFNLAVQHLEKAIDKSPQFAGLGF